MFVESVWSGWRAREIVALNPFGPAARIFRRCGNMRRLGPQYPHRADDVEFRVMALKAEAVYERSSCCVVLAA